MSQSKPHNPNELIAIVNEDDQLIDTATRKFVHENGLLHREVGIFIRNRKNEILLQKRADTKKYDPSAGGHVPHDQSYRDAAVRELSEELGISVEPKELTQIFKRKFTVESPKYGVHDKFIGIFELEKEIQLEEMHIDPAEVLEAQYFSIQSIKEMLRNESKKFEEDTAQTLPMYIEIVKI